MKAVILAAGIGSRLQPLTATTPKALLPVGGVPLLRRAITALRQEGLREIVIVTGYLGNMIEEYVRSLAIDLQIQFLENPVFESTNNNYSLWLAKPEVLGHDMLMLDADILFERTIVRDLLASPEANALIVRTVRGLGAEEVKVECGTDGYVRRIGKEIDPQKAMGESLGIEKFSATTGKILFGSLDRRKHRNEFYEASFQEAIDGGAKIGTVDAGQRACIEIDTPDDLSAAGLLALRMHD